MSSVVFSDPSPTDSPQTRASLVRIASVGTAEAGHSWSQDEALSALAQHFPQYRRPGVKRMFKNCGIDTRQFALPLSEYNPTADVNELHALYSKAAPRMARDAALQALEKASVKPSEIDLVVAATCTGYLCPGLSVYLTRDLGLSDRVQRADLVGMGCAGALPALQRGFDFVKGNPQGTVLVVTVEVCSACCYVDETTETVVGNAICGDGAAAVILQGSSVARRQGAPQILGFETLVNPDWMSAVGLENKQGKLRIILSKEIRHSAGPAVAEVVTRLLDKYQLKHEQIKHWVFHAGGAAVLSNIEASLGFKKGELACSRDIFRRYGNMSSPTTLFVLKEVQETKNPQAGDLGVALALGPGLATEAALLRW